MEQFYYTAKAMKVRMCKPSAAHALDQEFLTSEYACDFILGASRMAALSKRKALSSESLPVDQGKSKQRKGAPKGESAKPTLTGKGPDNPDALLADFARRLPKPPRMWQRRRSGSPRARFATGATGRGCACASPTGRASGSKWAPA